MLEILIPIGFVIFILYILNTQINWWKHLMYFINEFKKQIFKWSR